ncbi:hypothetical protein LCGC14_2087380 [marine sediment metagenome]|uniref:Uncharacterized protein n=1 Tax=marine sediment metagenome TaxID=412755 RepID=A0A0F9HAR6_9ZZZZ
MLFRKIIPYTEIDPTEEAKWVIEGLIQKGGVNFITGEPKTHKSFLRKFLVASALSGKTVFDQFDVREPPQRVLTLIIEDRIAWERRTMDCMFDSLGYLLDPPIGVCKPFGFKLNNSTHIKQLIALVKREGYDFVTIDPLIEFHSADENNASEMSAVTVALHQLAQFATLLVVHHSAKSQNRPGMAQGSVERSLRGSGVISGASSLTMELTRIGLSAAHKLRKSGKETESLDDIKLLLDINDTWCWELEGALTPERVRSYILGHPGLTTGDLARRLGKRKELVVEIVEELLDCDEIAKAEGPRQRQEYFPFNSE